MKTTNKTTEVMVVFSDHQNKVTIKIIDSPDGDNIARTVSMQFMPEIKKGALLSPAQDKALDYFRFLKNSQGE